ncbi:16S rRNA (cytidine(1402)-2'-O)-methyltransferase, partial [Pontibaca methylaminivorans]|uniref:16S rRNA (cytidine(1402)-2'-O)-methyltransferase n=1 Tax=Pontibaca methylaminivorans TaxID=515897 RepID=UPI002FDAF208
VTLSGLPADRFLFAGFLPQAAGRRKTALAELAAVPASLIFYESPHRVAAMLRQAVEVLGGGRKAVLCREMTKKFEEVLRGTLQELADMASERRFKGEIVVLIGAGENDSENVREIDLDRELTVALDTQSMRDAADAVSTRLGLKRRDVYQRALALAKGLE